MTAAPMRAALAMRTFLKAIPVVEVLALAADLLSETLVGVPLEVEE